MTAEVPPRTYTEWRTDPHERAEDAAHAVGRHLIAHCRDEALATLPPGSEPDVSALAEKAVDTALHDVLDMLEGFWRLEVGDRHAIDLALQVRVKSSAERSLEPISPPRAYLSVPSFRIATYCW